MQRLQQRALAVLLIGVCLASSTAITGAAGSFDGTYRGTQHTTLTDNSGGCSRAEQIHTTLTVRDNHFTRHWASVTLDVSIAADGTFSVKDVTAVAHTKLRTVQVSGKITGSHLEADIGTDLCTAHLSLKR